ncbi:MAG: polyprenol monophosphomannose synthase [Thermoplasmata archaeon]|nr:polyprenol monophosphomannose synthase [Thermoplasmata archaeon]
MPRAHDVSLILPTYNEREALRTLLPRIREALSPYSAEVLVVDDNSPDGTAGVAADWPAPPDVRVLERPSRLGLASAVTDGLKEADGRVLVVMDADGSHPPESIRALVEPILGGRAEFALGSRHANGGSSPGLVGPRRMLSWGASLLARPLTPVHDPMSGFFAVSREAAFRAPLTPVGYKIALEVLAKCRPYPVVEVPYCFAPRIAGESKLDRGQVGEYLHHLGRLYAWRASRFGRASRTR